jgi:hypothetical protein
MCHIRSLYARIKTFESARKASVIIILLSWLWLAVVVSSISLYETWGFHFGPYSLWNNLALVILRSFGGTCSELQNFWNCHHLNAVYHSQNSAVNTLFSCLWYDYFYDDNVLQNLLAFESITMFSNSISIEQSASREAKSRSTSRGITHITWNPKVHAAFIWVHH